MAYVSLTMVMTLVMVPVMVDLMVAIMAVIAVLVTGKFMTTGVVPVKIVTDGVDAPVGMRPFPFMKPLVTNGIERQPKLVRTQVIILRADDTHILVAIINISIRHRHLHGGCRHRGCHDHW